MQWYGFSNDTKECWGQKKVLKTALCVYISDILDLFTGIIPVEWIKHTASSSIVIVYELICV